MSIRQYARPNGEVVALLVVTPSKTDRERVIPMTAELFHVVATIIRRLTLNRRSVPLATRFDPYERITSAPQPFLFQRTIGQRTEVINPGTLRAELGKLSDALAVGDPELAGCRFTHTTPLPVRHRPRQPRTADPHRRRPLGTPGRADHILLRHRRPGRHHPPLPYPPRRPPRAAREYLTPTTNDGTNSKSTSISAKSSSATVSDHTPPPVNTNTPASDAPCCRWPPGDPAGDLHDERDRVDQYPLPEGREGPRALSEEGRCPEMPVSGHQFT